MLMSGSSGILVFAGDTYSCRPDFAMDPERWKRLRPLLEQAMDLEEGERAGYLKRLHAEDAELAVELDAMLNGDTRSVPALEARAADLAAPELSRLQDPEHDRIGSSIGPYRLVRLIGSGGMGKVYLAERAIGGSVQQVALKLMRSGLTGDNARERFYRERELLAQLRHPHIASLLDAGETEDGLPYFTLEYVEGLPIVEHAQMHTLDVTARMRLVFQIASALAYAHRHLIIHRDIKPSNIVVTPDGKALLLDFGIAKLSGTDAADGLTRTERRGPMTPEYAAPEQFRARPVSVATDVYQFGVLIFRLLSGRLPYRADPADAMAWAQAVTEQDPITLPRAAAMDGRDMQSITSGDLRHLQRQLRGDLDIVVRKALAKSPDDRYQSIDAMTADLDAWMQGRPVSAQRARWSYVAGRFIARHRIATTIAGMLMLAIVIGMTATIHQARRAEREARRAEATVQFMSELFQMAEPSVARDRDYTLREVLDSGVGRLQREYADERGQRGRLLGVLAEIYMNIGDNAAAETALQHAVHDLELDGRPQDLAMALRNSAILQIESGHADAALALLDRAGAQIGLRDAAYDPQRLAIAMTRGRIERSQGRANVALSIWSEAMPLAQRLDHGSDGRYSLPLLSLIATAQSDLGDHAAAVAAFERGAATCDTVFGAAHWRCVRMRGALGWALVGGKRDLERARALLEQAMADIAKLYGTDSLPYYTSRYNLGNLHSALGDHETARVHYEAAADGWSVKMGAGHPDVGWALSNVALQYVALGNHVQAREVLQRCADIFRAARPMLRRPLAEVLEQHARVADADMPAGLELQRLDEAYAVRLAEFPLGDISIARNRYQCALFAKARGEAASALRCADEAHTALQGLPDATSLRIKSLQADIDILRTASAAPVSD
jgi:serine/threonine protein kinase/tetratricopeptide (TPR) repeat protein